MARNRKTPPKKSSRVSEGALAHGALSALQAPFSSLEDALSHIRGLEGEIALTLKNMAEKVRQLEILNSFSALLNSSLDPGLVREKALEATCQLLRCDTASLLLVDRPKNELYWETALGETGKALKDSVRLPINEQSIAGWVALHAQSVTLNDVQNDPRHFKKAGAKTGFKTLTMVCVPLQVKGEVVGVLQAINKSANSAAPSRYEWAEFSVEDQMLLETLGGQVAIAVDNARLYSSLKHSFYDTVEALAESIEKKDSYTGGHTKRVVYYSTLISKYLDLTDDEIETIRLGALLHDVGKIGIEDKILRKQSPLDTDEWKVMMKHPEIGYDIMSRVEGLKDVVDGMKFHHEKWDGTGYPDGLKGESIPLIARVIAVADTYDAMVSTRPYRKGLDPKIAFTEISNQAGKQFDPWVVDGFKKAFAREKMGRGSGGDSRSGSGSAASGGSHGGLGGGTVGSSEPDPVAASPALAAALEKPESLEFTPVHSSGQGAVQRTREPRSWELRLDALLSREV